jgi:hypothetical protein
VAYLRIYAKIMLHVVFSLNAAFKNYGRIYVPSFTVFNAGIVDVGPKGRTTQT